ALPLFVYPARLVWRLQILDLRGSRQARVLVEGSRDVYQPCLSADGARVLFLSTARFDGSTGDGSPQAFIVQNDGSGLRQLTQDPSGVARAILSGNGRVAYLLTRAGRLLKLGVDSGAVRELVGRTPFHFGALGWWSPGGIARLTGAGFSEQSLAAT